MSRLILTVLSAETIASGTPTQSCVLSSHLTSLLSALWSLSCTVVAGHEAKKNKWEQSLGVVLQLWSESWNAPKLPLECPDPQLELRVALPLSIMKGHMLGAGCDRRAGLGGVSLAQWL